MTRATKAARGRVISEALGGSPLSLAVQARRLPTALQPRGPATPEEWTERVNRVRQERRGSWYEALGPALAAQGEAAKRIERVASEGGVVVTTGQQAALFGGPLYTLAKALTAIGLADALEQRLGIPAAPVFWAATDDADFVEASSTYVADADGLHHLELVDRPPAGTPLSLAPLGDTGTLAARLRRACGSAAHAAYFEMARAAFTNERMLGDAYVRMLRDFLGPLGVAVMDSSHPAYRAAARPTLLESLARSSEIAAALAERALELRQNGLEPQVEDDRGLSLVFAIENGLRRRLSLEEAGALARDDSAPAALAPNVLLRPVVERDLFPTVAYVGGPAELAYFTQSNVVASSLGRDAPLAVPRWSCTIIEPFAERAMERLGVQYHELRDASAVERRLATAALPPKVAAAWGRLQARVRESVEELGDAVRSASLMPPEVVEGLGRSLQHKLGRAERRLLAAVKRREERIRRDITTAAAALFPLGKRQERVLNFVPMLARGGPALLDEMRSAARAHALSLVQAERAEPVAAR